MIINVSQLLKEPIGSTRSYRVDEAEGLSIFGEVVILRTDQGVLVQGDIVTKLTETCGRCLSSFEQALALKLEEEYLLQVEEEAFVISEHREIDLSEAVRQYTLLVKPMKPLCHKDCAGLCFRCGKNLNLGSCDCPKEIDPRLAVLASLAKDR